MSAEHPRSKYQFAVAPAGAPEQVLGTCGLRLPDAGSNVAEFGLELAAHHWGRRYGAEAAVALLQFGFETLGLVAVRAETVSANIRAAALCRRLGFWGAGARTGEAWLQQRGWYQQEWRLDREEWTIHRR